MNDLELRYIGNVLHNIEQLLNVIAGVKTIEEYKEDRKREWIDSFREED